MPRLVGRTAIITGAGDGIGRGIASRFAREGAAVVVADYDQEAGSRCAGALNAAGAHAIFVRCDVADRTQVEAAVAAAMKRFGSADILICPAAVSASYRRFSEMQPEMAARIAAANPMGRMGDPETDIGGVALFLASEDARYLTGNTLYVDGGAHINGVAWIPEIFADNG